MSGTIELASNGIEHIGLTREVAIITAGLLAAFAALATAVISSIITIKAIKANSHESAKNRQHELALLKARHAHDVTNKRIESMETAHIILSNLKAFTNITNMDVVMSKEDKMVVLNEQFGDQLQSVNKLKMISDFYITALADNVMTIMDGINDFRSFLSHSIIHRDNQNISGALSSQDKAHEHTNKVKFAVVSAQQQLSELMARESLKS
jgi:F0F1-type ATP synthase membrane subunit c/vacuolar-type H+-ATPase subunit K